MQTNNRKKREKFLVKSRQFAKLKRIDGRYIFREIADVFLAKSGLFYTIKKMLISPGKSVRQYLEEDRKPFVRPIVFVIVTSLIFALADFFLPVFDEARHSNPDVIVFVNPFFVGGFEGVDSAVLKWISEASAYTTLLIGLFIAFFVKLFFRKSGYNFFEIFVLLCYVCGVSMLFYSTAVILWGLTGFTIGGLTPIGISFHILPLYAVWAIGQFFDKKQRNASQKAILYIKGYLSYGLGATLYGVLFGMVSVLFGTSSISEVLPQFFHLFINTLTLHLALFF